MSTILVEDRMHPGSRRALDAIAQTCRGLGHDVFRWRGPYSGRVGHWKHIFPCDLAVIFNGTHPRYEPKMARLRELGAKLLYVEVGWNPQDGTCQIDPAGINARASWADKPLEIEGHTPLPVREQGDLLLVLQLDSDTQIQYLSPWFANMRELVEFVCRHSELPIRVRHHPKAQDGPALRKLAESLGATWDRSESLAAAMQGCRAVACINSSCGVEALAHSLPVMCYGTATYRHEGAVYCLDNTPEKTRQAIAELAAGRSSLRLECAQAALHRILDHQWRPAEIAIRLPPLIRQLLPDADQSRPLSLSRRLSPIRLIRNLPEWARAGRRAA